MTLTMIMCSLLAATGQLSSVSGSVVNEAGDPVADTPVYLEQGLAGPIVETRTDDVGGFAFYDVIPGVVGVFCIAPGTAWGGKSESLGPGDQRDAVEIVLTEADSVRGQIRAARNDRVNGARITRVALLSSEPVGIPFAKLEAFGIEQPRSDRRGRFEIENLPENGRVALKIVHPSYAQAAVADVPVGENNLEVQMYVGVLITGRVVAQSSGGPVGRAHVLIRNVNPPHDTILAQSDARGEFGVRVMPGQYAYQAAGPTYRSAGWNTLVVDEFATAEQLTLTVAGTGRVSGRVMDAKTGEPVTGARVLLDSGGVPAALARTGPDGSYAFTAAAGETVVQIDEAPGYRLPKAHATRFELNENQHVDLPAFWIAPLSDIALSVLDEDGDPVEGASVRLVRPAQMGAFVTGESGQASIRVSRVPDDGNVLGIAEHPSKSQAALLSVSVDSTDSGPLVHLLPTGTVRGSVVDDRGRGIEGAVVIAMFAEDDTGEPAVLSRTVSKDDGTFEFAGLPGQIPVTLTARSSTDRSATSAYITAMVAPGESVDTVPITLEIEARHDGESLAGKRLRLDRYEALCESVEREDLPGIVLFAGSDNIQAIADVMASAAAHYPELRFVLVVDGEAPCDYPSIEVRAGTAPATATTYILDKNDRVVHEGFEMPSAFVLRNLQ